MEAVLAKLDQIIKALTERNPAPTTWSEVAAVLTAPQRKQIAEEGQVRLLRELDDIITLVAHRTAGREAILRVRRDCIMRELTYHRLCTVPKDYYDWKLEEPFIKTPVNTICKSLILENTAWVGEDPFERENARYYLILIQYVSTLSDHKVFKFIRSLKAVAPQKNYHFRMADESLAFQLSGFEHNAITPVGMKEQRVPIILAEGIVNDCVRAPGAGGIFWIGGGQVDVKLGLNVEEFIKKYNPFVADVYK